MEQIDLTPVPFSEATPVPSPGATGQGGVNWTGGVKRSEVGKGVMGTETLKKREAEKGRGDYR